MDLENHIKQMAPIIRQDRRNTLSDIVIASNIETMQLLSKTVSKQGREKNATTLPKQSLKGE